MELKIQHPPVGALVKAIAIGAEGQEFDSLAAKIGHGVANVSPSLPCFFGAVLFKR